MIRKNIYSRITESIVNAYHNNNLDTAMEDGHEMENMGKKIVAIITADPDSDLDWESEYEPFGREELSDDDEAECCEFEGIDHDTCPSCGSDVDGYIVSDDCEDCEDEDVVIGSGADSMEDVEIKDILVDILDELRGEGSESDDVDEDENPMFGGSSDDEEDEDDDEDENEDADSMLAANDDWASDESDDEEDEDAEEDMNIEDMLAQPQEQEEDEVEIFDSLD